MATVQELQTAIADLKLAAEDEKTQIAQKLKELEDKLVSSEIPDSVLTDLQATTQEIKGIVASPVPETNLSSPTPAPSQPVTVTAVDNPPTVAPAPF